MQTLLQSIAWLIDGYADSYGYGVMVMFVILAADRLVPLVVSSI